MKIEENYVPVAGDKRLEYELHFTKKYGKFEVHWKSKWDYIDPVSGTDYDQVRKDALLAGSNAVDKYMRLGKKILIGVKSNSFKNGDQSSMDTKHT